jgi:uncharacterized C2H2 Zn-finger protein
MPLRADERPRHNPHQLRCPGCHRFFRNQSGLTKHVRSCHSGQVLPRHQRHSPSNASEVPNALPIHRSDESSSQGNQDSTPRHPSTVSQDRSPSGSSIQLPHQDGSFSPVYSVHGSERSTPEINEPIQISKVFHPIINGLYMSCPSLPVFLNN